MIDSADAARYEIPFKMIALSTCQFVFCTLKTIHLMKAIFFDTW